MTDTILVVDDNIVNRKLLESILKKAGYTVLTAVNGEEAVSRSFEMVPDLILLDVVMPKKDGYQACVEIKQFDETADIPIVFLSAKSETHDKIKGLEAGGVDYVTKPFNKEEVLARVRAQLKIRHLTNDLKSANDELLLKQKKIEDDLKAAGEIQKSLLPKRTLQCDRMDLHWRFIPCETVGGDIFNVFRLSEEFVGLYMLDVSGHGVPSALVTVSTSQALQPQTGHLLKKTTIPPPYYSVVSPSEVLNFLDKEYPLERFEKYFTIAYILFNHIDGSLRYSSAAHPPPVLLRRNGSLELLEKGGTIIGMGGMLPFEEGEVTMEHGDKLFLYTDGITEYEGASEAFFGEDRFYSKLVEKKDETVSVMIDSILDSMMDFGKNASPKDDVSLLGFEYVQSDTFDTKSENCG